MLGALIFENPLCWISVDEHSVKEYFSLKKKARFLKVCAFIKHSNLDAIDYMYIHFKTPSPHTKHTQWRVIWWMGWMWQHQIANQICPSNGKWRQLKVRGEDKVMEHGNILQKKHLKNQKTSLQWCCTFMKKTYVATCKIHSSQHIINCPIFLDVLEVFGSFFFLFL